ncbi:MAG: DUF3299 domain-containing protein [Rhodobacteraceae bacterium]|nr:DUF3299 domain-containing protein [Paracoccaceae bacterium]
MRPSRRNFLNGTVSFLCLSGLDAVSAAADTPVDLNWDDLVPRSQGFSMDALRERGVIQHGELSTPFDQERNAEVTDKYNGQLVRIPGYLVPLEYDGQNVTSALLVPYVGACIHVPPPPPNQLIFVIAETPYNTDTIFDPVNVTGLFETTATNTELAEVGYTLIANRIEPYS